MIRTALVGIGNCASSLVQGVEFYRNAGADGDVPGLMHLNLGGYHVSDIQFTAAFDMARSDTIWGKRFSRSQTTR